MQGMQRVPNVIETRKNKRNDALLMAYRVNLLTLHRDTHVKIFFDCSNAVMQKEIVENCIRTILETNFQVFAPIYIVKYNSLSRFYMKHFSLHYICNICWIFFPERTTFSLNKITFFEAFEDNVRHLLFIQNIYFLNIPNSNIKLLLI